MRVKPQRSRNQKLGEAQTSKRIPDVSPGSPTASAEGLAPRDAALALIKAGLERRGGFDDALNKPPFATLPARERPFARALASTTFRRLGQVDRLLASKLERTPPPAVLNLLRIGAVQLLFMDTPAHAAVSTVMAQAEVGNGTRPFKGLINAVLRGLAREAADMAGVPAEANAPSWLFARWRAAYGEEVAQAIAARIVEEPPTDLTLRDPSEAETLAEALEAQPLPGGGLRTWRRGELSDWPGFADGRWWVQDVSAGVAARLLEVRPDETVLDLCAAPGGKTLQLAAAGAQVTALDRSGPRLQRVSQNLARMALQAEIVTAEAATWADTRQFDAVLVDAPCSATGTFRRHPDVLWAAKPGDIAKLCELQVRLLDSALRRLRPGGRLVYCVCSLEPEEGEAQVAAFLARHGDEVELSPIQPGEGGAPPGASVAGGTLRILPSLAEPQGGVDGFFVARFTRRA